MLENDRSSNPKFITRAAKFMLAGLLSCAIVGGAGDVIKANASTNMNNMDNSQSGTILIKSDKSTPKSSNNNSLGKSTLTPDSDLPSSDTINKELKHNVYMSGSLNRLCLSDFSININSDSDRSSDSDSDTGPSDAHHGITSDILSDREGFDGNPPAAGYPGDDSDAWTYMIFSDSEVKFASHLHYNFSGSGSDNGRTHFDNASDGAGPQSDADPVHYSYSDGELTLTSNKKYYPSTNIMNGEFSQYAGAIRHITYKLTRDHDHGDQLVFRPVTVTNMKGRKFKVSNLTALTRPLVFNREHRIIR